MVKQQPHICAANKTRQSWNTAQINDSHTFPITHTHTHKHHLWFIIVLNAALNSRTQTRKPIEKLSHLRILLQFLWHYPHRLGRGRTESALHTAVQSYIIICDQSRDATQTHKNMPYALQQYIYYMFRAVLKLRIHKSSTLRAAAPLNFSAYYGFVVVVGVVGHH